jgi:hypothetical protein
MSTNCPTPERPGSARGRRYPSGVALPDIVHVVMGGGIVVAAYRRPDLAMAHARCVTGATVCSFDTRKIAAELRALLAMEVLEHLPASIKVDIEVEWEHDNDTPVVAMDVSDLEDA